MEFRDKGEFSSEGILYSFLQRNANRQGEIEIYKAEEGTERVC